MKRVLSIWLFFILFLSFSRAGEMVATGDLGNFDLSAVQWIDLGGTGEQDGLLIQKMGDEEQHQSQLIVISKKNGHLSKLWQRVIPCNSLQLTSICFLEKGSKIPFVILGACAGASIGCQYHILRWDAVASDFKELAIVQGWNAEIKDIRSDGEQQLVLYDRYGEDLIYEYAHKKIELANDLFPEYFKQPNREPSEENVQECIKSIQQHDVKRMQSDFYVLQMTKNKNDVIMDLLEKETADSDPKVRTMAVQAIAGVWSQPKRVIKVLMQVIRNEKEWSKPDKSCVGFVALYALAGYQEKAAQAIPLLKQIENQNGDNKELKNGIEKVVERIIHPSGVPPF